MKSGAEPKKVAILVGLLVVAALVLYFNVFAGDPQSPPPVGRPVVADPVASAPRTVRQKSERKQARTRGSDEFKLHQGVQPGETPPDPSTIDPTLRLDLLAKLQQVEAPGQMRNIFQYGAAPPPAKPIALPTNPPKIAINNQPPATAPPSGPPPPPPPPAAPRMSFKYYGYTVSKSDGHKKAFLLDGEDIIVAGENEDFKRGRYKINRIGNNSITIEDTQFKSSQTLPLAEDTPVA